MKTPANHTAQDAFERLIDARIGSLADSSDEYLMALRQGLHAWISQIDAKMAAEMAVSQ